jgi:hypothetical protein
LPSTSKAQHGFAGMSSTAKGRSKLKTEGKKPMPKKVAKDFLKADKGKTFSKKSKKRGS